MWDQIFSESTLSCKNNTINWSNGARRGLEPPRACERQHLKLGTIPQKPRLRVNRPISKFSLKPNTSGPSDQECFVRGVPHGRMDGARSFNHICPILRSKSTLRERAVYDRLDLVEGQLKFPELLLPAIIR